jgi:hypothetical protein
MMLHQVILSWSGSVNVPWLSLNPQNGVTPDTIEVIADQDSLAPGCTME